MMDAKLFTFVKTALSSGQMRALTIKISRARVCIREPSYLLSFLRVPYMELIFSRTEFQLHKTIFEN